MWIVIYIPIYTHLIKSEDEVIYYDKIHRWLDNLIESGKITNLKFKSAIVPDWFFERRTEMRFFFCNDFSPLLCVISIFVQFRENRVNAAGTKWSWIDAE